MFSWAFGLLTTTLFAAPAIAYGTDKLVMVVSALAPVLG